MKSGLLAMIAVILSVAGCRGDVAAASHDTVGPSPIGHAECGSCSMVVGEQPAPRGQLVHRDGTREHFCSIDDMMQYLRAPSRHGEAVEIYVEAVEPGLDPATTPVDELPWMRAESAHFVTGVKRNGIMGPPVLTYEHAADAESAATRHKGHVRTWQQLRSEGAPQQP